MIFSEVYVPSCSLWGRELGQQVHMLWCLVRIFEGQPRTRAIRGRNVAWLHLAWAGVYFPPSPPPPDLVVHVRVPLFAYVVARYWWRATRWPHLVHGGLASPASIDWVAHARYQSPIQFSILITISNLNVKSEFQSKLCHHILDVGSGGVHCHDLTWHSNFKLNFQFYRSSSGYLLRLMFVYTTSDIYLTLSNIQIWNLFITFSWKYYIVMDLKVLSSEN